MNEMEIYCYIILGCCLYNLLVWFLIHTSKHGYAIKPFFSELDLLLTMLVFSLIFPPYTVWLTTKFLYMLIRENYYHTMLKIYKKENSKEVDRD